METNFCCLYLIKVPAIVHLWLFIITLPKKKKFLNFLKQFFKITFISSRKFYSTLKNLKYSFPRGRHHLLKAARIWIRLLLTRGDVPLIPNEINIFNLFLFYGTQYKKVANQMTVPFCCPFPQCIQLPCQFNKFDWI